MQEDAFCGFSPPANLPKTAIFGCSGFIGSHFLPFYRKIHPDCAGAGRRPAYKNVFFFDLEAPDISGMKLAETGHTQALLLAAVSEVALCESRKAYTRKINVTGTLELIRQLAAAGIKPIFASSDYVFDGISGGYPDDAPLNPITEYGRQKAEVEARISEIAKGNCAVIRLSKIFGLRKGDGTLFDEMARILAAGGTLKAAYDQRFCPLLIRDLLEAVAGLQAAGASGIINVCSAEKWSRYDLAAGLAREMGVPASRVERASLDDILPGRPKNTTMETARLRREISREFTPIADCIKSAAAPWRKPDDL